MNLFSGLKTYLYKHYGENPGKMLVHTGVLGWILSSLAQVSAIVVNDKISPEQKSFLIPQEIADAGINILSFYLVTSSFKKLATRLVESGKLSTTPIKNFLKKEGLTDKIGKFNFNIEREANFQNIKNEYRPFKNGIDVIASTTGSILSCNIITPILRNRYAAKKQKQALSYMNKENTSSNKIETIYQKQISISDYQKLAAMRFSNSSMKV